MEIIFVFGWLLAGLLIAQGCWVLMRHWRQFLKYKRLWDEAAKRFRHAADSFDAARARGDQGAMRQFHDACHSIIEEQKHYMRAQRAVMDDNFIAPWHWPARWNADYLEETKKAA